MNPTGDVPEGVRHFKSIAELPEIPSLALIVLGARDAPAAIEACGKKGIKTAIIITSGFEEIESGKPLAEQLRAATRFGCSTVVGPNSEGVWSLPARAVLSHGSAARRDHLVEGPVSILSQSGSIGAACLSRIQDWGIGCRFFVSVGNETLVNMLDYLEFIIEEGSTRVCALFVEGLTNGQRLRGLLERARLKNMKIVALKGGISVEGRLATQSHTGKMSSPGEIYSSIFKQLGIVEANNLLEFFDLVAIAAQNNHSQTVSSHSRVGIVAFSGGCRALIVDRLVAAGLQIARFAQHTEAQLRALLPSFAYIKNPVDPSNVILRNPQMLMSVIRPIMEDPDVGAFILQYPNWSEDQVREHIGYQLDELAQLMHQHEKPVIVSLLGMDFSKEFRSEFIRRGIALARDPADAARYVECIGELGRSHSLSGERAPHPDHGKRSEETIDDFTDQMRLLGDIGIDVPAWKLVGKPSDLDSALADLGFPLVAKSASLEVLHKSDRGLVRLDIQTKEQAKTAFAALQSIHPGPVLLQEMVRGTEILLSVSRDRDFGPVLCVARGGVFVEHNAERAYLACPVSHDEVREALERAKLVHLLSGLRGREPSDIDALLEAAVKLSAFFHGNASLDVIELNPVIVGSLGQGVKAVDIVTMGRGLDEKQNTGVHQ